MAARRKTTRPSPRPRGNEAELEVAIVGEGLKPRDIPLREVIALLEAMAAVLEETAKTLEVGAPACTLTEVREGSAEYAMPVDHGPNDELIARTALDHAKRRGVGAPPSLRRSLARLHKASGVGAVRLTLRGPHAIEPFLLAAPKEADDPELEEAEEVAAVIVGVAAVAGQFKVRLRLAGSRTEEFTAEDAVAERAASFFNRAVRAHVTFLRSEHEERPGIIEDVDGDDEVDFFDAIRAIRDDVQTSGAKIDATPYLGDEDDTRHGRR